MEPNPDAEFFQVDEEVVQDPMAPMPYISRYRQYKDACERVAAIKNANNVYSFRPFRVTECLYKHNHPIFDYPYASSGHRIVVSDSNLYCLVNYCPDDPHFHNLWSYNFASSKWKLIVHEINNVEYVAGAALCSFHGLDTYYNALVCYGGTDDLHEGVGFNTTRVFTTGANPSAVQLEVTGDIPVGTIKPGMVIYKDNSYVIGGKNRIGYSCDVFRLDLATRVWHNEYTSQGDLSAEPEGRFLHEVVCDGEFIFILGGGTAEVLFSMETVPAYNMRRKDWSFFNTLPDMAASSDRPERGFPVARKYFAAVQHTAPNGDVEVYITGGRGGAPISSLSDIWRLNLRSKQWTQLEVSLPKPMFFHAAGLTQSGCLYIFGGYEEEDGFFFGDNYMYKMWATIPALSEMCWECITQFNHNLNAEQLLENGVPQRFVDRLPVAGEI